jgi:methyl-accepting chemotaxis protein
MSNATLTNSTLLSSDDTCAIVPDNGENEAWEKAIRSGVSTLPIMASQLREVAHHVEESVVKVCSSFQGMIDCARETMTASSLIDDEDAKNNRQDKLGINHLIVETRETMHDLLERIEHTSTFSSQMVERLRIMEGEIDGLKATLGDIDDVARNSHLLALNGQLEAARAGEQGAAFAIVATETAKMAVHAVDASKKIRRMIEAISKNISGASNELQERATNDIREADLSRNEVNHSLDTMTMLHDDMQKSIDISHDKCKKLARDITEAVVAMQFQDAVNQRIEHVVHVLLDLHAALNRHFEGAAESPHSDAPHPIEDWHQRMAKSYTMASEHKVLAAHRCSKGKSEADFGNNVELF